MNDEARAAATAVMERRSSPRARGPRGRYESWSKAELYEKARRAGVEGRSRMSWRELIEALRNR